MSAEFQRGGEVPPVCTYRILSREASAASMVISAIPPRRRKTTS